MVKHGNLLNGLKLSTFYFDFWQITFCSLNEGSSVLKDFDIFDTIPFPLVETPEVQQLRMNKGLLEIYAPTVVWSLEIVGSSE